MAVSDKHEARTRVETARRALDDDLATLTDRLPAAAVVAQAGAVGGTGLALLGIAAKRLQKKLSRRSQEQQLTREAEIQARAIAAAITAAGLQSSGPAPSRSAPARPATPVAAPRAARSDDDDGGTPWGIILLLAALAAAVVALVNGARDDQDLWQRPGA